MPLQTDFDIDPYYNDFDDTKDYYKILFKPSAAVQTRELNQLQSMLQKQIERFGDNVFKRGTIVDGCNITLHPVFPYVKIKDLETDGTQVNIASYENLYVKNSDNVTAYISKTFAGYESQSPDLNTLFVKYISSGDDGNTSTFSANDTLTVFDPSYPIFRYRVQDGSSSFSNNDTIVVTSAIAVQNSSGGTEFPAGAFDVNHVINNGVANAIIVEANTTANNDYLILKIKPKPADLLTGNATLWTFANSENIINQNNSNTAKIVGVIGYGARGSLTTDNLGKIISIAVANSGVGYYVPPHVSVSITSSGSSATSSDISNLDVLAQNYKTNITVANTAQNPIGSGYGISVDEGVIFQKGYFSRVTSQLEIVNKYSNTEFTKSVGFYTEEEIITSNQDLSLLDNSLGTPNSTAPGADRLKLTPVLYVLNKEEADANAEFLPIVEFADGNAFKTNQQTVYNIIGDEMAKKQYEQAGDFVLDQFLVTSKDASAFADTSDVFKLIIDPGKAYITGKRIETTNNYSANVDKGKDIVTNTDATIKVGYGNYVLVNELAGVFQFNYGALVSLYDTAQGYLSTTPGGTITPTGNLIGTARIRSLILDSGEPGTPNAIYRLYLFDIVMSSGNNFNNVKSIYFDGTAVDGICDVVLEGGLAVLKDSNLNSLLFKSANAVQDANAVTFTYRTMNESLTANTTGYISISPPGGNESFPYADGALGTVAKRDLVVIPLANYQASANIAGSMALVAGNDEVTGTSTDFTTTLKAGDFIKVANATANVVVQVSQVANATHLKLTSNAAVSMTGNAILYFPRYAPVSLTNRPSRTVTKHANGQLVIALATNIANSSGSSSSANVAVVYNVTANNTVPTAKTVKRKIFTRIVVANNVAGNSGPWALGVSDVFRLRGVYKKVDGNDNTVVSFDANTSGVDSTDKVILIPNNPFANGDSIIYNGNTELSNLSNGNSYYVVGANSTALGLSATKGGAKISIAPSADETHTLTGKTLFFGSDTYGVENVTNEFYIDSNQKEDYLDTSYLYLKPRKVKPGANDVLLVEYDAFVTTSAGVKTIKSYPVNDSVSFANLSNTEINTLEVPEMVGLDGTYYDLRDQFDFRPVSANTIAHTSDITESSIINPSEPSDANRFSAIEQKFPVPDTDLTADVNYYLGRNDRVILDNKGRFSVIKGVPGVYDAYPDQPEDSMTLQLLEIPPYPSLPVALSSDTIKILDTGIANEKYGQRKNLYTIKTPLDAADRAAIQTRNYTMEDIASLDRRIKDLEYYVSFTLAETVAKMRFLPSSIDPTAERFKFGFFVDPFTSYQFSDTLNPEYYATIENDQLYPKTSDFNIEFVCIDSSSEIITPPYVEDELVTQPDCTDDDDDNFSNTTIQVLTTVYDKQKNPLHSKNPPYIYDEFEYVMSEQTGPVKFFINNIGINLGDLAVEVYQRTSPESDWSVLVTSAAAEEVTLNDYRNEDLNKIGMTVLTPLTRRAYGPVGGFLLDKFKLLWNHNPENGRYYKIRVYKGNPLNYKFKLTYPIDVVTYSRATTPNPTVFQYYGTIDRLSPKTFTITSLIKSNWLAGFISGDQKFRISIKGLKPNTSHRFVLAGEDKTSDCVQVRDDRHPAGGLVSNKNGKLEFDYYYKVGSIGTTDLTLLNNQMASLAGVKNFEVISYDGVSYAVGSIELKYYVN